MMKKPLLLLSFIEGGAVMAAELCGARLLAPVFGSSLFVWASVMGITLIALGAGYFTGGLLANDSSKEKKRLLILLTLASLVMFAMPGLALFAVPRISYMAFIPGMILSTFLLLFPSVFLLGATSPLFISLQSGSDHSAGKTSGMVYGISTAGGILATFLCGFFLIPELGLNVTLISFGALLLLMTGIAFRILPVFAMLTGAVFIAMSMSYKRTGTLLLSSESLLGKLEVYDVKRDGGENIRLMLLNNIIQSEMSLHDKRPVSEYMRIVGSLIPHAEGKMHALLLGLGGGQIANMLNEKKYITDAVEYDERIIEAARKYFYLDGNVSTFCQDSRYYINHCAKRYSVIVADIFKAEEQPSHVFTTESLNDLKKNLAPGGVLLINWHGYRTGEEGAGTRMLLNTLAASGYSTVLHFTHGTEAYSNLVVEAHALQGTRNADHGEKLNSDDKPALEKYNALANKEWRTSYLRYYQGR